MARRNVPRNDMPRRQVEPMAKRKLKPATEGSHVLPMALKIGDRFTCARGEWRVIGRPFSASGGKTVFARARLVQRPSVIEIHLWGAHERVAVKRTGGA